MDRPNILFLLSDEHNYRFLSCLSSEQGGAPCRTPALDRLAFGGKRLTQWYSGYPVCTSSRTALMTGRQPARVSGRSTMPPAYGRGVSDRPRPGDRGGR